MVWLIICIFFFVYVLGTHSDSISSVELSELFLTREISSQNVFQVEKPW